MCPTCAHVTVGLRPLRWTPRLFCQKLIFFVPTQPLDLILESLPLMSQHSSVLRLVYPEPQSPRHAPRSRRTTHTARPRANARGFGGRGAHAPPEHNSSAQSGGATINAKRAPTRSSRSMSRHRKVRPRRMVMGGERERVEHGGHARESTRGSDFRGWQSHWACRRLEETRTRDACGARRGAGCYDSLLVAECHVVCRLGRHSFTPPTRPRKQVCVTYS